MKRNKKKIFPFFKTVSGQSRSHLITAEFLNEGYRNIRRELTYPETSNITVWRLWRKSLRATLREYLNLDEWGRPPTPAVKVLEELERGGYTQKKITYESVPGNRVTAYLLIPKQIETPVPAVLCPHGHVQGGRLGVVDPKFALGVAYGREFAERGCVVLAPDNAGMGERDIVDNEIRQSKASGCELLYRRLSHMGLDITGLRVFELMVGINILANTEEVNASRIGCAGLSGGCWLAEVLTALDSRIKAVILSGFFTTFLQTVWNGHCICHLTHGLGKICDMPDIAALIAPRPLFVESGKKDKYFPSQPAYSVVQKAYTLLGAGKNLQIDLYEGGHMFYGKNSIPWMMEQLKQ